MARYQTAVRTPWSRDRAFAYLSDLRNFADWDPGVNASVQVGGDGPGRGATYDLAVRSVGPDLTMRYETVAFEVGQRIEVRAQTSTLRSIDIITFADIAQGGCVVTYDADLSLRGILAAGNPLLGVVFRRIGDRAAKGLVRALDGT